MKNWQNIMATPITRKMFHDFWEKADLEIAAPNLYEKMRDAFYGILDANTEDLLIEKELNGN